MQANGTSQASANADAEQQQDKRPRPGAARTRRPRMSSGAPAKGTPRKKVGRSASGPREGSAMWAVIQVLRGRRKPMTAGEIYAEIERRGLAPGLKGKTPDQTVGAALAVHAKRGVYVERAGRGKFRLRKGQ
jgi:HB1/ASXL restriction endonuclease-like protein with HTH domain